MFLELPRREKPYEIGFFIKIKKNRLAKKCACMERGSRLQVARIRWSWREFRQLVPFMFDNQLSSYFPLYTSDYTTNGQRTQHISFIKVAWRTIVKEIERNTSPPPISLLIFCCFSSCFQLVLGILHLESWTVQNVHQELQKQWYLRIWLIGPYKSGTKMLHVSKKLRSKEHIT